MSIYIIIQHNNFNIQVQYSEQTYSSLCPFMSFTRSFRLKHSKPGIAELLQGIPKAQLLDKQEVCF